MLGMDVPRPEQATLGGGVAVASSGLRRVRYGAVRDNLIGVKVVMQGGTEIKGGGKVVKNVAGYDLCKLFTGSYGSLGIITEVTFRVHPFPEVRRTIAWDSPDVATAARVGLELHQARLAHTMLCVSGNSGDGYQLIIGFDGIEKRVNWQQAQAESVVSAAGLKSAPGLLTSAELLKLQNAPADSLSTAQAAARINMLVTALPTALQRFEGAAPSLLSADISAGQVQIALDVNSHAGAQLVMNTLPALGPDTNITWHHLEGPETLAMLPRWGVQGPALRLHRAIKASLDTSNLFSPDRFPGRA
jgi:glycolate oxidase FAD binding subunit